MVEYTEEKRGEQMKIVRTLMVYILLGISIFAQEAYVASFNTLRLGKNEKDYELTAKILAGFDLVGLIEVMNQEGVEDLITALEKVTNTKWSYHISPYPVGKSSYKEYFAYVWKDDRVTPLKVRGYYPNEDKIFSRPPYGADFKIDNIDFTFVLAHSIFGKTEKVRRREAFRIEEVYEYFQDLDPIENDVIIAGDFNLSALDEAFENFLKHRDEITYTLDPRIKTTLGASKLASSYDNMFISKKYTGEFEGKSGAVDFTKENYKMMKKRVSDHLPIFIILNSSVDDD